MAAVLGGDGQPVRDGQLIGESMAAMPVHAVGWQGGRNVASSTCTYNFLVK